MFRRTKIVATLGPASSDPNRLARLIDAGVNVFRLNFSHGSADDHRAVAARVRRLVDAIIVVVVIVVEQGDRGARAELARARPRCS